MLFHKLPKILQHNGGSVINIAFDSVGRVGFQCDLLITEQKKCHIEEADYQQQSSPQVEQKLNKSPNLVRVGREQVNDCAETFTISTENCSM